MSKILLIPGHGGKDSGAIGNLGGYPVYEKDINLIVSQLIFGDLNRNSNHILLATRHDDTYVGLKEVCDFANNLGKIDLAISIHCNAVDNKQIDGHEIFYFENQKAKQHAEKLNKHYAENFPHIKNRGVKEHGFYVLKNIKSPSILIELSFITNNNGVLFLSTHPVEIAKSISEYLYSI